jgi:hypothetical protein
MRRVKRVLSRAPTGTTRPFGFNPKSKKINYLLWLAAWGTIVGLLLFIT